MVTEFLFFGSKSPGPQGHMASDCPEPEVCRRCRKEGHVKDDCPEPEKCFNCRQEGHSSADCPEPELCRKCRKPVRFLYYSKISFPDLCELFETITCRATRGTTARSRTSASTAGRRGTPLPTVRSPRSAGGAGRRATKWPTAPSPCAAASKDSLNFCGIF